MYKPYVVIVDQSAESIQEIEERLNGTYECVAVSDPADAVSVVQEHQPVAVVIDFPMPLRTGGSVTAALKENPATSDIPIVAFSSWDYARTRATAKRIGCSAFVGRSAGASELLEALRRVTEMDGAALQV